MNKKSVDDFTNKTEFFSVIYQRAPHENEVREINKSFAVSERLVCIPISALAFAQGSTAWEHARQVSISASINTLSAKKARAFQKHCLIQSISKKLFEFGLLLTQVTTMGTPNNESMYSYIKEIVDRRRTEKKQAQEAEEELAEREEEEEGGRQPGNANRNKKYKKKPFRRTNKEPIKPKVTYSYMYNVNMAKNIARNFGALYPSL